MPPSPSTLRPGGVLCGLTCQQCGFLSKVYSLLIKSFALFRVSPAVEMTPFFISCLGEPVHAHGPSLARSAAPAGDTATRWASSRPREGRLAASGEGRRPLVPSSLGAWLSPRPGAERTRPVTRAQLDKEAGPSRGRQDTPWLHVLRRACGSHAVAPCGPGCFGAFERRLGNLRFPFEI